MTILDSSLIEAGSFRLIQQWGSGLKGVDLNAAEARDIWVANVPAQGGNADSVVEHVLLLILALLRQLPAAQANVRAGILGAPLGRALAGHTVCLSTLAPCRLCPVAPVWSTQRAVDSSTIGRFTMRSPRVNWAARDWTFSGPNLSPRMIRC